MKLTSTADQRDGYQVEEDEDGGGPLVIIDIHPRIQSTKRSPAPPLCIVSGSNIIKHVQSNSSSSSSIIQNSINSSSSSSSSSSSIQNKVLFGPPRSRHHHAPPPTSSVTLVRLPPPLERPHATIKSLVEPVACLVPSCKGKHVEVVQSDSLPPLPPPPAPPTPPERRRRRSSTPSLPPTPEPTLFEEQGGRSSNNVKLHSKLSYFGPEAVHWKASFRQAKLLPDGSNMNRCEWREREGRKYNEPELCGMTFATGEDLARHVMSKHVGHAERNNGKIMCRWSACRNRSYVPEAMREHALRHMARVAFCCPFVECKAPPPAAPLATFQAQQKHVREHHRHQDKGANKLRPVAARPVVPSFAAFAGTAYMQNIKANAQALERADPEVWWSATGASNVSALPSRALPDRRFTVAATMRKLPQRSKALAQVLPLRENRIRGAAAGWSAVIIDLESREPAAKPFDIFAYPRPVAMLDFEFSVVSQDLIARKSDLSLRPQESSHADEVVDKLQQPALSLRMLHESCPSEGLMSTIREWLLTVPIGKVSPPPSLHGVKITASQRQRDVAPASQDQTSDAAASVTLKYQHRFGRPDATSAKATLASYLGEAQAPSSVGFTKVSPVRLAQSRSQYPSSVSQPALAQGSLHSPAAGKVERIVIDLCSPQPEDRVAPIEHGPSLRGAEAVRDQPCAQALIKDHEERAPRPRAPHHWQTVLNEDERRNVLSKETAAAIMPASEASDDSIDDARVQKKARIESWVAVVQLREARQAADPGLSIPLARSGERVYQSSGERDDSGSTSSGNPNFQLHSRDPFRQTNTHTLVTSPSTSVPALFRDRPFCP